MTILITGGTGYLGSELVRQATARGAAVVATYHTQPPLAQPGVTWLPLDLRDPAAVAQLCAQVRPTHVLHTAFRQHEPDLWAVTATGAGLVAAAAQQAGARLVHLSSDVLFDGATDIPYTEAAQPTPIMPYGAAKAEAERLVLQAHPAAALVRTSLIYGFTPVDRHTQFILAVADGQNDARLFRDELRCPVFVGDLAAAVLELATTDYRGVLNMAGAETVSRYAFGTLLAAHYGRDPARIASDLSANHRTRRPRNCALDCRRAHALLTTALRGIRAVLAAQPRP